MTFPVRFGWRLAKSAVAVMIASFVAVGCHSSSEPPEDQPSQKFPQLPGTPGRRIGVHPSPEAMKRLQQQRPLVAVPPPAPAASLDTYTGFSNDGLIFAYALPSTTGGALLHFLSVTTGTEEKTVPLDTPAHRQEASAAMTDAGLPPPGTPSDTPKPLGADVKEGRVVLTFAGAPASNTYEPFGGGGKIDKVEVIATTKDGKHAAVRIIGTPAKGQGTVVEFHVFALFG